MFGTNKNIKTANETIATLTTQLGEANAKIETLTKSLLDVDTLKKEHADKIEALTKEHATKVQELESAKKVADESAMKKARTIVTSMGIPEEEAFKEPVKLDVTYEAVKAKLESMTRGSDERIQFYNKNKGILTQPVNSSTEKTNE